MIEKIHYLITKPSTGYIELFAAHVQLYAMGKLATVGETFPILWNLLVLTRQKYGSFVSGRTPESREDFQGRKDFGWMRPGCTLPSVSRRRSFRSVGSG
jgi:hypothetical protein